MAQSQLIWRDEPCKACGQIDWEIRKCINGGGHSTYLFVCAHCGTRTQHFVSAKVVRAAGLEPREIRPARPRPACQVCGQQGAEQHHWAPWALFGAEAAAWPQSYLCRSCHDRWHQLVTPQISAQQGL